MHVRGPLLAAWLFLSALAQPPPPAQSPAQPPAQPPPTQRGCPPDKLTVYTVTLTTFWTRDKFPKHYPDWRPPAQFSKLLGRTHDGSHMLYRAGTRANSGVKLFAETGRAEVLETRGQGEGGIYDEFSAPPITVGAGQTQAQFFVDGNHSLVSMMARITPSPDWFIGVDSFNLCVDGNWLDSITIEVDPMDAGTDNGFTFTAPNWLTQPQGVVYRITSRYPAHPAGSFYYPYLKRLPPIATFQFVKVREYELSQVLKRGSEGEKEYQVVQDNTINVLNSHNEDVQLEMEQERREQERRDQQKREKEIRRQITNRHDNSGNKATQHAQLHPLAPGVIHRGHKDAILNSIVEVYHKQEPLNTKPNKTLHKFKAPRDCKVGDWGEWSTCSMTCGIGEMTRRREIVKHARRGGAVCPPLQQTKWCGSARECKTQYFNW